MEVAADDEVEGLSYRVLDLASVGVVGVVGIEEGAEEKGVASVEEVRTSDEDSGARADLRASVSKHLPRCGGHCRHRRARMRTSFCRKFGIDIVTPQQVPLCQYKAKSVPMTS